MWSVGRSSSHALFGPCLKEFGICGFIWTSHSQGYTSCRASSRPFVGTRMRGKNCVYFQDWIPEFNHDSFTLLSSQTHSFHVICHHLRSNSSSAVRKTIRLAGRNGAPRKWCSLHKCSAAPLSARIPPIRTTHAGLDRMIAWKWLSYILRSIDHLAGLDMRRV